MKTKQISLWMALGALCVSLIGCGIIPKPVEFFQDKVEAVPTPNKSEKETQKQAADLAAKKAEETYRAAIRENASESVLSPASDTSLLTRSLTTSLGPPLNPWKAEADLLAARLDAAVAALDRRMDKFTADQQQNVGKKIEGSGLFSVPWIVYVGVVGLVIFVVVAGGYVLLQVAKMSNPGVAVGTRVISMGASAAAKGISQLARAGENFKDEVKASFDAETKKKILDLFQKHHRAEQDSDVQNIVQELTK